MHHRVSDGHQRVLSFQQECPLFIYAVQDVCVIDERAAERVLPAYGLVGMRLFERRTVRRKRCIDSRGDFKRKKEVDATRVTHTATGEE